MADDTTEPKMDKPINDDDIPSHDEIIEKPYYDKGSAPTIKILLIIIKFKIKILLIIQLHIMLFITIFNLKIKITIIIIVTFNIIQCQEHQNKINKNILQ